MECAARRLSQSGAIGAEGCLRVQGADVSGDAKYGSASKPADQPQDFQVRLKDLNGKSRAIRVSVFTNIPYPYERGLATRIKSALKTVRIPLESYTIANLGKENVDLANLESVSFEFAATSSGEVKIDDIEFSA